MTVQMLATVENVEKFTPKTGGTSANVTVSELKNNKREFLSFISRDVEQIFQFESLLQTQAVITLDISQNSFGTRISDVLAVKKNQPLNVKTGSN